MDNFINKNIPTLYTLQLNPLFFFNSLSLSMATRIPFTESQWEELENQTLVFKYLAANAPVPPHLLFLIRRPFLFSTSSSPSTFFSPHRIGWNNVYEMGMGRKVVDAEPGRCRRTDGKKWRCSKEASHDSKYCERHMHRGKNRSSRKPLPPPLALPQFSVSSSLNLSLHSSSKHDEPKEQHCFILGTDLSEKLKERGEEKDYDEEEQRSKRFYRFLDEWPSSKPSSVSTSLFI